ncbi:MAG: hypothetical protein ACRD01_10385 [Terriglobales bacterium]
MSELAAFAIEIDFVKGRGSPSRPFRVLVDLTEAFARLDRDLVRTVDATIEPVLLLENVEAGSIRAWFATVLRSADDNALASGDWKKIVGAFAVKSKYMILKRLEGASSVTDPELLEGMQIELLMEAERTGVRGLPGYAPISRTRLAAHIAEITVSLESLSDGDSACFQSPLDGTVPFNTALRVVPEEMTELLASRILTNDIEMILKVKKPDYLGSSMWEFRHEGHPLEAKIADEGWVREFHVGGAGVVPGSALRASVRVELAYDLENEALPARYTILKVLEVLPPGRERQELLPLD